MNRSNWVRQTRRPRYDTNEDRSGRNSNNRHCFVLALKLREMVIHDLRLTAQISGSKRTDSEQKAFWSVRFV